MQAWVSGVRIHVSVATLSAAVLLTQYHLNAGTGRHDVANTCSQNRFVQTTIHIKVAIHRTVAVINCREEDSDRQRVYRRPADNRLRKRKGQS